MNEVRGSLRNIMAELGVCVRTEILFLDAIVIKIHS